MVFVLMEFIAKLPLRIEAKRFVPPRSQHSGLNPPVIRAVTEPEMSQTIVSENISVVLPVDNRYPGFELQFHMRTDH